VCVRLLSGSVSVNVSQGGRTRDPREDRPILSSCQRKKHSCPLPLNQTLPSSSSSSSSSSSTLLFPSFFCFVCIPSGDNGRRLSVTRGLTQIHRGEEEEDGEGEFAALRPRGPRPAQSRQLASRRRQGHSRGGGGGGVYANLRGKGLKSDAKQRRPAH